MTTKLPDNDANIDVDTLKHAFGDEKDFHLGLRFGVSHQNISYWRKHGVPKHRINEARLMLIKQENARDTKRDLRGDRARRRVLRGVVAQ